ncbi:hypothetical protein MNBD_GAMMA01-295 [hydrothermal vent metagenome]|uniref:Endonuclease n=1 Tax=hydrothermal vent metagenome TaxID=652676 RepID=A0A3B0V8N6_9ZZZZ
MKLIIFILAILYANTTLAYNAAGHHLVAAISWDLLTTKRQNYWVEILKHHPRFDQDFKQNIPKYVKSNPAAYNEWIFRQAAVWPDLARGLQPKQKDKYHHGSWHYINYPIYLDKKFNTRFLNLNTSRKYKLHNDLNIIQALKGNIKILSKKTTTKKQKALALSWVLHLSADAHQPLHSSALFSKNYFPKGDRGGNSINIKGQGRIKNLHWYWDSRLNNTTSFKVIDLRASKLTKKYKNIAKKRQHDSIVQWLKDSNKIATKYVYTPVILASLAKKERQNQPLPTIYLANTYDKAARNIASKQAAIAGFKLANILK